MTTSNQLPPAIISSNTSEKNSYTRETPPQQKHSEKARGGDTYTMTSSCGLKINRNPLCPVSGSQMLPDKTVCFFIVKLPNLLQWLHMQIEFGSEYRRGETLLATNVLASKTQHTQMKLQPSWFCRCPDLVIH